jgi:hypothetical protein
MRVSCRHVLRDDDAQRCLIKRDKNMLDCRHTACRGPDRDHPVLQAWMMKALRCGKRGSMWFRQRRHGLRPQLGLSDQRHLGGFQRLRFSQQTGRCPDARSAHRIDDFVGLALKGIQTKDLAQIEQVDVHGWI